jgi:23S rRNA maturation mini-RNase III
MRMRAAEALPRPPDLQGRSPRTLFNATVLAYVGDSIWEVSALRMRFESNFQASSSTADADGCQHVQVLLRLHVMGALSTADGTQSWMESSKQHQRRRLNGRDLTIAAQAKANAEQQAAYFNHLMLPADQQQGQTKPFVEDSKSRELQPADENSKEGDAVLRNTKVAPPSRFELTDEERDVLRWGRNSTKINIPRGLDTKLYKKATALEVLVSE